MTEQPSPTATASSDTEESNFPSTDEAAPQTDELSESSVEHPEASEPQSDLETPANMEDIESSTSIDQSASPQAPASSAENSGDQDAKKAEEGQNATISQDSPKWQADIQKFHNVVNEILASKENLKLNATNSKTKSSFVRNWTLECNRFFQLTVQIRRRKNGDKFSGKILI